MKHTTFKSRESVAKMMLDLKRSGRKRERLESNLMQRLLNKAKRKFATQIEFPDGQFDVYMGGAELRLFGYPNGNRVPIEYIECEVSDSYFDGMPHRFLAEAGHSKCVYEVVFKGDVGENVVSDVGSFMVDRVLNSRPGNRMSVMLIQGMYDDDDARYVCTLVDRGVLVADEWHIIGDKCESEFLLGMYEIPDEINDKLERLKEKDEELRKNVWYNTTGHWS